MKENTTQRLVNRLKVHHAMRDLTQGDLADQVDVTRKSVNSIENGHFVPSTEVAWRTCSSVR